MAARRSQYKPGDTFVKKNRGIDYLMQVQEKGRAKPIKRLTPYKMESRANTKSKVPRPAGKEVREAVAKADKKRNDEFRQNFLKPDNIRIVENSREVDLYVRRDSKTFVVKHKKIVPTVTSFETTEKSTQEIVSILRRKRFTLATEKDVQAEIEKVLQCTIPGYKREVKMDEKSIIDFMVGSVGIEVKIGGTKSAIYKQLQRYAECDQITELILVTSKTVGIPPAINNKNIYVVNMSKAWL